jgi:hypothetical protein
MKSIRIGAGVAGLAVALGVVGYALFGRGSSASAADPPKGPAAYEQALANALGIPLATLQAAEKTARSQVFPQGAPNFRPNGTQGGRPGGPGFGFGGADIMAIVTQTLGLSQQQIQAAQQQGQTLAQIAGANLGALKAAIVNAEQAKLQDAFKNGKITQDQMNKLSANIPNMVDRLLNFNGKGRFGPGGPRPNGAPNFPPGSNHQ